MSGSFFQGSDGFFCEKLAVFETEAFDKTMILSESPIRGSCFIVHKVGALLPRAMVRLLVMASLLIGVAAEDTSADAVAAGWKGLATVIESAGTATGDVFVGLGVGLEGGGKGLGAVIESTGAAAGNLIAGVGLGAGHLFAGVGAGIERGGGLEAAGKGAGECVGKVLEGAGKGFGDVLVGAGTAFSKALEGAGQGTRGLLSR